MTLSLKYSSETDCADKSLMLVDDDDSLRHVLDVALSRRGFAVTQAGSVEEALANIAIGAPAYAVIDLSLGDGCGLEVAERLHASRPDARFIILSGYGTIATAVAATKLGAIDFLVKPALADEIVAALRAEPGRRPAPPPLAMTAGRVRWEHIQHVFRASDRNVSETARQLSMHRRTLQRVLSRGAPV
jgi:two-component system, response regulator RegA